MAASVGSEGNSQKQLAESLKRFCRSIELCDDYLRGYYGLKKVSQLGTHERVNWDANMILGHG